MKNDQRIEFLALGAADSIGGSAYLLKVGPTSVMIDFGIHPDKSPQRTFQTMLRILDEKQTIPSLAHLTAVVLTHAHTDHSGLMPALYRETRQAASKHPIPFYASLATQNLLPFIFENVRKFSPDLPYAQIEADTLRMRHLRQPDADGWLDWYQPDLGRLKFIPNSHLLGAVMVEFEIAGRRIVSTGDIQVGETPTLPPGGNPTPGPDLLILDGTHAVLRSGSPPTHWQTGRQQLFEILDQTLQRRGVLLLPSFALGRSQDILALVMEYSEISGKNNFYIYVDGQSRVVTRDIYPRFRADLSPEYLRLYDQNKDWRIQWTDPDVDLQDLVENEIQDTPAVVIASSGMLLPGSASRRWAEALLNTPENWIVFTGHLIEDIREEVFDRGVINEHKWKKRPGYLNISGHASFQDTLAWVEQLAPKAVVLVHCGSDGAVDLAGPGSLAQALNHKGIPTIVARQGQPYIF